MRTLSLFCLVVGVTALLLVSCGREAPFVEPGSIAVESTPEGAAISINGDPTGQVTPHTFSDLEPTQYEVAVSLDGYISDPPSIFVNVAPAGRETATFILQENIGTLVVNSTPTGATIFIDDVDTGETTDHSFELVPGDYTVRVELASYAVNPASRTMTVTLGDTATAEFTLSQDSGSLTVTSTPAEATIVLDGTPTAEVTPATIAGLVPDDYEVTVQLAGYTTPAPQTVTVVADQTATADFTLQEQNTTLAVTADVDGLTILLDGPLGLDDTQVTPHVFTDITAGTYNVAVQAQGFSINPTSYDLTIIQGDDAQAHFGLTPIKVVMMEGFSNVNCVGCPFMTAMIENLLHTDGYGADRLLYTKYSLGWPTPLDPHYLANTTENLARESYYAQGGFFTGLPTLFVEGALQGVYGTPPTPEDLQAVVDLGLAEAVPFAISVSADFTNAGVPVDIAVSPILNTDLSGHSLIALLGEEEIHYDVAPGSTGETEFHWVMLDIDTVSADIGQLTAGTPLLFSTTLVKPAALFTDRHRLSAAGCLPVILVTTFSTPSTISSSTSGAQPTGEAY